jgi:hypothetical protein
MASSELGAPPSYTTMCGICLNGRGFIDSYVFLLKLSQANELREQRGLPRLAPRKGCVPGLARLLNGDVRYYDTDIGQSPDPA